MTKRTEQAEASAAAVTETRVTTEPKKTAPVVKTDNSKNGHLAARRAARAKAHQEKN
ncbi:hypothetical protein [Rheinheimera maricola]|uniref:Uncharacterized protein n=1 Tax=Rheinheimera maricola TaxID=2793282 RepID=A0ABS7X5J0_9GAMM|nr:hypothetical protein [Rheinheimera maricola]MBZ9610807.1 hypothetical protein [Rheinheimera maricola]